jgi:uncharacterized membrane protein YfcA
MGFPVFVPLFYYLGVPLGEATSTALLLNAVSLSAAAIAYARGGLVDWRMGIPVLLTAVVLAPLGAALTPSVERSVLLALFVGFVIVKTRLAGPRALRPGPIAVQLGKSTQ